MWYFVRLAPTTHIVVVGGHATEVSWGGKNAGTAVGYVLVGHCSMANASQCMSGASVVGPASACPAWLAGLDGLPDGPACWPPACPVCLLHSVATRRAYPPTTACRHPISHDVSLPRTDVCPQHVALCLSAWEACQTVTTEHGVWETLATKYGLWTPQGEPVVLCDPCRPPRRPPPTRQPCFRCCGWDKSEIISCWWTRHLDVPKGQHSPF